MTKLLFVQASPRGSESKSVQVAEAYLSELQLANPEIQVDTLKLWEAELPSFDGNKAAAKTKVMLGQMQDAEQKTAWDEIASIAARFIAADRYLFAVPMWNSGIPYRLKHYIDIVHQPGLLWELSPETGYFGLLKDKHATLALTAGAFSPANPSPAFGLDYHSTYMQAWLNQAGITAIDELRFEPTMLVSDPAAALVEARASAVRLARAHGRV